MKIISNKEYREFQEYKKWLDTPVGYTVHSTQCPEENKHCSCIHIPYDQETLEDIHEDELGDIRTDIDDLWHEIVGCDGCVGIVERIKDLEMEHYNTKSVQKLINTVIEAILGEFRDELGEIKDRMGAKATKSKPRTSTTSDKRTTNNRTTT